MILSDLWPIFQGHDIIQRQTTQKRYKIKLYSQKRTNRKSYDLSNGAILNDLQWKSFKMAPFDLINYP